MPHKNLRIHNTNSLSHFIDRLVVENIKLYDYQRRIEVEISREEVDHKLVTTLYQSCFLANEARAAAKNEIDKVLSESFKAGAYDTLGETRTFKLALDDTPEVLPRMGEHTGTEFHNDGPAEIKSELFKKQ
jgi:hypothetical protein